MSNKIVECCPCYDLKYDETAECLRDQTFAELKVSYGKGSKIQCNCWSDRIREYKVDSSFVAAHMKSQRHINWREEQQKEHKQKYGHCISNEKIIETLRDGRIATIKRLMLAQLKLLVRRMKNLVCFQKG